MKLIIDIPEEDRKDIGNIHFVREDLKFKIGKAIMNGTPLDDVKAEIEKQIERTGSTQEVTPFTIADAVIQECPNKAWLEDVIFYLDTYNKTLDILDKESEDEE